MVKIAVLASFNMDLVMRVERRPEAGETVQGEFAMHLGGKGFNQAVAARRLRAEVVVCGRVGDDEFGRLFLAALDEEGIDRRAVVVDPEAGTGVATIYVEPNGENTIVQSPRANRNVVPSDWEDGFGRFISDAWELSDFFLGVDACMTTLETGEVAAKFAETYSRLAPLAMLNAAPAEPVSDSLLRWFQLLVVNEIELKTISGMPFHDHVTMEEAARSVVLRHPRRAVIPIITLGSRGAVSLGTSMRLIAHGFETHAIDTTGAGDAFCAALVVRLAEMKRRYWRHTDEAVFAAMGFANAAGALACTKHGAYPSMPYRDDVEALLREQGPSI